MVDSKGTCLLDFERRLWEDDVQLVAGIDEVGRGCLAGDVVAAAVIFPIGLQIEGVWDSKKLTAAKRSRLYDEILSRSVSVGVGVVDREIIDAINIRQAARLAMKQAVSSLRVHPDYLLVDAESVQIGLPQEKIIRGDQLSHSIAAASIVAKVFRDRMCAYWDTLYPGYGFRANKGYGTREHRLALQKYGPSPLHRRTFLRKMFGQGCRGQVRFEEFLRE